MFFKNVLSTVGLLATSSLAAPTPLPLSADDISVLQLAHYLENLEFNLYSGGCKKFTDADYAAAGASATQDNVCTIAKHENIHRKTLATVLKDGGVKPFPACTYTFPYTDAKSFLDVANMITSGGIGAYLGGSELLIDNPVLEEAAASIVTVEARHDAYLRLGVGGSPFPNAFDTALTPLYIFSLVQQFIVSCPQQLPLTALPKLTVTAPAPSPNLVPVPAGTEIDFAWDPSTFFVDVDPNAPLYIAMVNQDVSAPIFQKVTKKGKGKGSVPLPAGVAGAAFAALTTFSGGLTLDDLSAYGTLAGPAEIIAS